MSGFAGSTYHWPGSLVRDCQAENGCCNGFFRLEKIATTDSLVSNLDNDILPIFAAENINGLHIGDEVPIVVRLASLLVEASLPFWHSPLLGSLVRTGPNDHGGMNFDLHEELREFRDMDEMQKSETRARLGELAEYIKFSLNTRNPDVNDTVKESRIGSSDFLKGFYSTIYVGKERIDALDEDTDEAHHLLNLLLLARDICHELAHAVLYARWPEAAGDNDYTFFEGIDVAEEGLAWESRTFGGILRTMIRPPHIESDGVFGNPDAHLYGIDGEPSTLNTSMICMTEWPNQEKVKEYQDNNWPLGVKKSSAQVADPYMIWNVPFSFVAKLFRKKFWEHDYTPGRHDALHVPLSTGFRYRCAGHGHNGARFRGVPARESPEGVPKGFRIEDEGGMGLPVRQKVADVIQRE